MFSNDILPQKTPKFNCKNCDFYTCNKKDYTRHIETKKHESMKNQGFSMILPQKTPKNPNPYICDCGKIYKDYSGLWRHHKKCVNTDIKNDINTNTDSNLKPLDIKDRDHLIMMLIKENSEFKSILLEQQNMMLKVIENGTNNTNNTNNTNINSHNKAFNLNFFLNETCKDAMNITDFVDSIKLELSDLEKVGEVGYIEGISNIIIKNLNALDETKRPVHCTDKKREIIYVKDQGQWEKEDDNKTKIKRLISKVSSKNSRLLTQYREKYPDCKKCDSRISDKFNKMVIEAMGGPGENNKEKEEKIIRNIAKSIIIDKSMN